MTPEMLGDLKSWFDSYAARYLDTDPEGRLNIELKIGHTARVCTAMQEICAGEGITGHESLLAETAALLHDAGRFEQYRKWRTYRDSESENHAKLGVDAIRAEKLLESFPEDEITLIEEAVRYHNLIRLPVSYRSATDLYIKLIRDADKIDIWKVFREHFTTPPEERPSAATLGLSDLPEVVNGECIKALAAGETVRLDLCSTINDFILLQISWVYDLNFNASRRLLLERGHIEALASRLPDRSDIGAAVSSALQHLHLP